MSEEIKLGRYPQTVKDDDVAIYENVLYNINGFECYKGSDNYYYVKETFKGLPPYFRDRTITLSNGKIAKKGENYYFKIEDIVWRVIDEKENGEKTLLSKNAIDSLPFDTHVHPYIIHKPLIRIIDGEEVYPNRYEYSNIRAYLNSIDASIYQGINYKGKGFIDLAFSKDEREKIIETLIDNTTYSLNNDEEMYFNTFDKVSLLSVKDAQYMKEKERIIKSTDYVLIKGELELLSSSLNSSWWTRSPSFYNDEDNQKVWVTYITDTGEINKVGDVDSKEGVVPLIHIKK